MRAVMNRFSDVYQMELLTDDGSDACALYESLGLSAATRWAVLAMSGSRASKVSDYSLRRQRARSRCARRAQSRRPRSIAATRRSIRDLAHEDLAPAEAARPLAGGPDHAPPDVSRPLVLLANDDGEVARAERDVADRDASRPPCPRRAPR